MSISNHQRLDELCAASGIIISYYDIRGVYHEAGVDVKKALLGALGSPVGNDDDILRELEMCRNKAWVRLVAPVQVHRQNNSPIRLRLTLSEDQIKSPISWEFYAESGHVERGLWEIHADDAVEARHIDETLLRQYEPELPVSCSHGYHRLNIRVAGENEVQTSLIVAPETCYQPPALDNNQKRWGISLQLYSLRSRRNWGIGDFTDLRSVIDIAAPLGIDCIGLNPLHALFFHQPDNASPYSPSSRDYLNPIYLDVEAIAEYRDSPEALQLVKSDEFQACLKALREQPLIDYRAVLASKLQVLQILYRRFQQKNQATESTRESEFRQFQVTGGQDLYRFCLFEALQTYFHNKDRNCHGWQQWPLAFQDPESSEVRAWAQQNISEIEFYLYLQWNSERQFSDIEDCCQRQGMALGIYRDLAVGNEKSSAQCWAEPTQYAMDMGAGAPPDDFNLNGQNWGLPPPKPQSIGDNNYRIYINTLRANMRYAGALRIDHVMGLMQLYWVPPNCLPDQGTYVSYPFADLLGILALESVRNRCLIIGEDLGTVPDDVRHALALNNILSYRILCFEKNWQIGSFKAPGEYPRYALCTAGSHDLPTLRGFWQGIDLELRSRLNLFPSPDIDQQQRHLREQDRIELINALQRENLISDDGREGRVTDSMSIELALSIQRYLARSRSALMMLQLEDMLMQEQQVNVPGTIDEYPNWRTKVEVNLEDWLDHSGMKMFAQVINLERSA